MRVDIGIGAPIVVKVAVRIGPIVRLNVCVVAPVMASNKDISVSGQNCQANNRDRQENCK